MSLSPRTIDTIIQPGRYQDRHGLQLKVTPSGTKSWVFRYQMNGKRHDMGLGQYPAVSLSEARKAAMELRVKITNGIDPLEERKKVESDSATFETEAYALIERHKAGWSKKHAEQWENSLRDHVFPTIGQKPVNEVDTDMLVAVLDPIWNDKPETAQRVRNRIERVLDFSKTRGRRTGDNPARWRGHLQNLLSRRKAESTPLESMHYSLLPGFMRELDSVGTRPALCLQFLILTACRSNEALGAKWDEIDFATHTWNIPAERMKNGELHQVPLSQAAMDILADTRTRGRSEYIFSNRRHDDMLANNALRRLMTTMAQSGTVHGFRATFRTWAAEKTNFAFDLCEIALSHVVGNKTARSYTRGNQLEKRRVMMDRWAKFAMERVHPEAKHAGANPGIKLGGRSAKPEYQAHHFFM